MSHEVRGLRRAALGSPFLHSSDSPEPNMLIPFIDLKAQYEGLKDEILEAICRVLDSAQFIGGHGLAAFENDFAAYCQTRHALGVANGTDALHLALRALGVGRGDEVITAANT